MKACDILLTTVNARYMHSAFGLRYLFANMMELQPRTQIMEFVLGKNPRDIAESLLKANPRIIGFGVYIWNNHVVLEVLGILRAVAPHVKIVLGGPEISYETESQELFQCADHVVVGEADFLFRDLCRSLLGNEDAPKLVKGPLPDLAQVKAPYSYYTDQDVQHRVIYVEASRGCPYKCEYCLSSLDTSVRQFPLQKFLADMDRLIERGVRQFKFVDRTFNLSPTTSAAILDFFLERVHLGLFLHFELVPDRLPADLREKIKKFPAGSLQFEIGVQTWSPVVAKHVSRRQDYSKIRDNFQFLREETQVHTHADLIVGLPGETLESFAAGFDALIECDPDEIQVGILKRLKGTPIVRHDQEFQMKYNPQTPFQLLSNREMSYFQMQKMQRFSQFWDAVANSGNFPGLMVYLKSSREKYQNSMFRTFENLADFLFQRHGQAHSISRSALTESLSLYLQEIEGLTSTEAAALVETSKRPKVEKSSAATPERQRQHLTI